MTFTPVGDELTLSPDSTFDQRDPSIAKLVDGSIVAVWIHHDPEIDGDSVAIVGRRINRWGEQLQPIFKVNSEGKGIQYSPSVTALSTGGFAVAWTTMLHSEVSGDSDVFVRVFDERGTTVADDILVHQASTKAQFGPRILGLNDGKFLVTWSSRDENTDGHRSGIAARIYSDQAVPLSNEFTVNQHTLRGQIGVSTTLLSNGDVAFAWTTNDSNYSGIAGRIFSPQNVHFGEEFKINDAEENRQHSVNIAALDSGGFAAVWHDRRRGNIRSGTGLTGRVFDENGQAISEDFIVAEDSARIIHGGHAIAPVDGGFLIAWTTTDTDAEHDIANIAGRRFWSNGTAVSEVETINSYRDFGQNNPSIANISDDFLLVSWASNLDGRKIIISARGVEMGPVNLRPTAENIPENIIVAPNILSNLDLSATTVSDVDSRPIRLSLSASNGTLYASSRADVEVEGSGTNALALTGTPANITSYFDRRSNIRYLNETGREGDHSAHLVFTANELEGRQSFPLGSSNIHATGSNGGEFTANTVSNNFQTGASIATLENGKFLVAWTDVNSQGDRDTWTAAGQLYNAFGVPEGEEFVIGDGYLSSAAVAALDGDRFVAAWPISDRERNRYSVRAQIYSANLERLGNEIEVTGLKHSKQSQVTIAALEEGGFVIAWLDYPSRGAFRKINVVAQRYNNNGDREGHQVTANTHRSTHKYAPAITGLRDGNFVIAWNSYNQGGDFDGSCVVAQRYFGNGAPNGPEFLLNEHTEDTQSLPALAPISDRGFVAVWESDAAAVDGDNFGISGRIFNAPGVEPNEFTVNSATAGQQRYPDVTARADGGFTVTWSTEDNVADQSRTSIVAQKFTRAGDPVGNEFPVNSLTDGHQRNPTIESFEDGKTIYAWTSADQEVDGSLTGIAVKIYVAD